MCGFYGRKAEGYTQEILEEDFGLIHHRGPDGRGFKIADGMHLLHALLAIIDVGNGSQPLQDHVSGTTIVFNGEIYNYKSLRFELSKLGIVFKTQTDTEVILKGYQAWGIDKLCKKLDGMFAFAIVDTIERRTYLARDKFGEKPLFYSTRNKFLEFGSCLGSFAKDKNYLSREALLSYLSLGFNIGTESIYQNVFSLPSGTYQIWDHHKPEILKSVCFWDVMNYNAEHNEDVTLEQALTNSVESRMVSDVAVGIALSGGIDSSLISYFAKKVNQDIETFSVSFPNDPKYDEGVQSSQISKFLNLKNHQIMCTEREFKVHLESWNSFTDEPILDPAVIVSSMLAEFASGSVKVLISGEGGDEIFGGYNYYFDDLKFREFLPGNPPHSLIFDLHRGALNSGFKLMDNILHLSRDLGVDFLSFDSSLFNSHQVSDQFNLVDFRKRIDVKTWLSSGLLTKFDRSTMKHGVEGRAPFLDPFLLSIGRDSKKPNSTADKMTKHSLRELGSKLFPDGQLNNYPKKGLIPPYQRYLDSNHAVVNEEIASFLMTLGISNPKTHRYFDPTLSQRSKFNFYFLAKWINSRGLTIL